MTIRVALASPFTLPFYCGNSILADRLKKGLHRSCFKGALEHINRKLKA